MIIRRPSIFIYTNQPDRDFLREVCAGIEEEGVFYEVIPRERPQIWMNWLMTRPMIPCWVPASGFPVIDAAMQMRGLAKRTGTWKVYHMPTYEQCRKAGR